MIRCSLGLMILVLTSLFTPGTAQVHIEALQGTWAIGPQADCAMKPYLWSISGDSMSFIDRLGHLNVERVVGRRFDDIASETTQSAEMPIGTQWSYHIESLDYVRVRNLQSGREFTLKRCRPAASPVPARTVLLRPVMSGNGRLGPSFDCAKAADALSTLICNDDRLAFLDIRFTQTYQALRQQVGDVGQRSLRQEAIDFQTQVYAFCSLPKSELVPLQLTEVAGDCVGRAYEGQRLSWSRRLGTPALEEATRPMQTHVALQQYLQQLGYISALSKVDGVYGAGTRGAIASWQTASAREPTGLLSDEDATLLILAAHTPQAPSTFEPQQVTSSSTISPSYNPTPRAAVELQSDEQKAASAKHEERQLAIARAEAEKSKADAVVAEFEAKKAQALSDAEADRQQKEAQRVQVERSARTIEP